MPCCSAFECSNQPRYGYRLFRFPSDPARRAVWAAMVRRDKWKPSTSDYLCEAHFEDDEFELNRKDGRKLLKATAVPYLFSHRPLPSRRKPPLKRGEIPPKVALAKQIMIEHSYYLKDSAHARELPRAHGHDISESRSATFRTNESMPLLTETYTQSSQQTAELHREPSSSAATIPTPASPLSSSSVCQNLRFVNTLVGFQNPQKDYSVAKQLAMSNPNPVRRSELELFMECEEEELAPSQRQACSQAQTEYKTAVVQKPEEEKMVRSPRSVLVRKVPASSSSSSVVPTRPKKRDASDVIVIDDEPSSIAPVVPAAKHGRTIAIPRRSVGYPKDPPARIFTSSNPTSLQSSASSSLSSCLSTASSSLSSRLSTASSSLSSRLSTASSSLSSRLSTASSSLSSRLSTASSTTNFIVASSNTSALPLTQRLPAGMVFPANLTPYLSLPGAMQPATISLPMAAMGKKLLLAVPVTATANQKFVLPTGFKQIQMLNSTSAVTAVTPAQSGRMPVVSNTLRQHNSDSQNCLSSSRSTAVKEILLSRQGQKTESPPNTNRVVINKAKGGGPRKILGPPPVSDTDEENDDDDDVKIIETFKIPEPIKVKEVTIRTSLRNPERSLAPQIKAVTPLSSRNAAQVKPSTAQRTGNVAQVKPAATPSTRNAAQVKPAATQSTRNVAQVRPSTAQRTGNVAQVKPTATPSTRNAAQVKPAATPSTRNAAQVKPAATSSTRNAAQVKPATTHITGIKRSAEVAKISVLRSADVAAKKPKLVAPVARTRRNIRSEAQSSENQPKDIPPATRIGVRKKPEKDVPEEESKSNSTWIPLDEYYYGKKEGDPTYREEKGEYRFKCWYCHKMLYNNLRLMQHMQGHIDSDKQQNLDLSDLTQCKHCYRQFDTPFEMQCHIEKVHQNNSNVLVCRICEKDHDSQAVLRQHMKNFHSSCEMPYTCNLCNFRSSIFSDVVDHFKKRHDSSQYVLCLYCLKTFKISFYKSVGWGMTQNFYQHMQKHQNKGNNKKCICCKLTFLTKQETDHHRARDHLPNFRGTQSSSGSKRTVNSDEEQVLICLKESGVKLLNAPALSKSVELRANHLSGVNSKHLCVECKSPMNSSSHYKNYVECTLCRFATSCSDTFSSHMLKCHSGVKSKRKAMTSKETKMKKKMFCLCGYSSMRGTLLANHLVSCSKRTCYASKPETKYFEYFDEQEDSTPFEPYAEESEIQRQETSSPDVDVPSLFGALGLVKKPRRYDRQHSRTSGPRSRPQISSEAIVKGVIDDLLDSLFPSETAASYALDCLLDQVARAVKPKVGRPSKKCVAMKAAQAVKNAGVFTVTDGIIVQKNGQPTGSFATKSEKLPDSHATDDLPAIDSMDENSFSQSKVEMEIESCKEETVDIFWNMPDIEKMETAAEPGELIKSEEDAEILTPKEEILYDEPESEIGQTAESVAPAAELEDNKDNPDGSCVPEASADDASCTTSDDFLINVADENEEAVDDVVEQEGKTEKADDAFDENEETVDDAVEQEGKTEKADDAFDENEETVDDAVEQEGKTEKADDTFECESILVNSVNREMQESPGLINTNCMSDLGTDHVSSKEKDVNDNGNALENNEESEECHEEKVDLLPELFSDNSNCSESMPLVPMNSAEMQEQEEKASVEICDSVELETVSSSYEMEESSSDKKNDEFEDDRNYEMEESSSDKKNDEFEDDRNYEMEESSSDKKNDEFEDDRNYEMEESSSDKKNDELEDEKINVETLDLVSNDLNLGDYDQSSDQEHALDLDKHSNHSDQELVHDTFDGCGTDINYTDNLVGDCNLVSEVSLDQQNPELRNSVGEGDAGLDLAVQDEIGDEIQTENEISDIHCDVDASDLNGDVPECEIDAGEVSEVPISVDRNSVSDETVPQSFQNDEAMEIDVDAMVCSLPKNLEDQSVDAANINEVMSSVNDDNEKMKLNSLSSETTYPDDIQEVSASKDKAEIAEPGKSTKEFVLPSDDAETDKTLGSETKVVKSMDQVLPLVKSQPEGHGTVRKEPQVSGHHGPHSSSSSHDSHRSDASYYKDHGHKNKDDRRDNRNYDQRGFGNRDYDRRDYNRRDYDRRHYEQRDYDRRDYNQGGHGGRNYWQNNDRGGYSGGYKNEGHGNNYRHERDNRYDNRGYDPRRDPYRNADPNRNYNDSGNSQRRHYYH